MIKIEKMHNKFTFDIENVTLAEIAISTPVHLPWNFSNLVYPVFNESMA